MRRIIIFFTIFFAFIFSAPLQASTTTPFPEPIIATESTPLIDKDPIPLPYPSPYPPPYYTSGVYLLTIFDKRGEAAIAAKIVFDEEDKEMLSNFTFFIPGKDISLARIVHEKWVLKKQCPPSEYYPYPTPMPFSSESTPLSPKIEGSLYPPNCYENYVSTFTTLEPKIEKSRDGLKVTISATPDVSQKDQESLLVLYRGKDYTKKVLTNYYFNLSTPQIPVSAATVQVGILVKEGLVLRGVSPFPSYPYVPSFKALERARDLREEENQELAAFSSDIMYQGILRKSDSDIRSESSFVVSGVFGRFWPLLYLQEAGIFLFVVLLLLVVIFLLFRVFLKHKPQWKLIFLAVAATFILTTFLFLLVFLIFLLLKIKGFVPLQY